MTLQKLMEGIGIGGLASTAIYLGTAGISYVVNTREINPNGIERKILPLDENGKTVKYEFMTIPIKNGDYVNMQLEKDGIYTSLEYRNLEMERELEKSLKHEEEKAQSEYDEATKKIEENYNKRKEKNDGAKKTFGWKTEKDKDQKEEEKPVEKKNNTNFKALKNYLNKKL